MRGLKQLKFLFGQRAKVSNAVFSSVTRGKQIRDDDLGGLEFYYNVSNCLATLTRMHYMSDLGSTAVMKLAVNRLPNRLKSKWTEFSYSVRKCEERTLRHLERWLQDGIMVARDPHLAYDEPTKPTSSISFKEKTSTLMTLKIRKMKVKITALCVMALNRLIFCYLYLNRPVEKLNGLCMNSLKFPP